MGRILIIIHEVEWAANPDSRWSVPVNLDSFVARSSFLLKGSVRLFGLSNSSLWQKARFRTYLTPTVIPDLEIAFLTNLPGKKSLLGLVYDSAQLGMTQMDNLRRPGVSSTVMALQILGLRPVKDSIVYSVAVSEQSTLLDQARALDGWLVTKPRDSSEWLWLSNYLFVALSIGIERSLISEGSLFSNRARLKVLRAPRMLNRVRSWPMLPPIDKTELADEYLAVRNSLHLTELKGIVLSDLEHFVRLLAIYSAALIAIVGLALGIFQTAISNLDFWGK